MDNNHSTLGLISLAVITFLGWLFYTPVKQKVWIKNIGDSVLILTTDTIVADKSVWYYEPDDEYNKTIRLSIYRDKEGKPYEKVDLVPNDYIYLKLKSGINWVHLSSVGTFPFINERKKIIKIKEVK